MCELDRERQEMTILKAQLDEQHAEQKKRDQKHAMLQDRLKDQLNGVKKRNDELLQEVASLETKLAKQQPSVDEKRPSSASKRPLSSSLRPPMPRTKDHVSTYASSKKPQVPLSAIDSDDLIDPTTGARLVSVLTSYFEREM